MTRSPTNSPLIRTIAALMVFVLPPAGVALNRGATLQTGVSFLLTSAALVCFFYFAAGPGLLLAALAWLHGMIVVPLWPGKAGTASSFVALALIGTSFALAIARSPLSVESAAEIARGEQVADTCAACHSLRGLNNNIGPGLGSIVGRPVASIETYEYSEELRNFGGIWSKERLARFLEDPQKTVPGTKMALSGLSADDVKALLSYLDQRAK